MFILAGDPMAVFKAFSSAIKETQIFEPIIAGVTFNKAVTVNVSQFGLLPMNMGSVAAISGGLGRAMSPVAAGAIICAGLAGVNPLEIARRNALGMIVAVTALMIFMLYI